MNLKSFLKSVLFRDDCENIGEWYDIDILVKKYKKNILISDILYFVRMIGYNLYEINNNWIRMKMAKDSPKSIKKDMKICIKTNTNYLKKITFNVKKIYTVNMEKNDKIVLNNKKFTKNKKIGSGSYGDVFEYLGTENESIAVKCRTKSEHSIEGDFYVLKLIKIIEKATNKKIDGIIDTWFNDRMFKNFYIMEIMDGTIDKLIELSNLENIFCIFYQVVKIILTLLEFDIYYTDIKLYNVLYKYNGDNTLKILLGDIGSAVPSKIVNEKYKINYPYFDCTSTYPAPENPTGVFYNPNCKDLTWGIGINLLLFITDISPEKYMYKTDILKSVNLQQEINTDIENSMSKFDECSLKTELKNIAKKCLTVDINERISLPNLMNEMNKIIF